MAAKYDPWGIGSFSNPTIAPTPTMPTPSVAPTYPLVSPRLYTPRLGSTGFAHFPGSSGIAPAGQTTDILNQQYGQYGLQALAGLNGATGPLTTNAGATANPFTTLRNVKSPEQEARIGQVAGDFDAARTSTGNALAEFTKKFLGNTPAAERNTAQENAVVDDYFSGAIGNTRAALRAEEAAAAKASQLLGFDHWRRNFTSNQLLRPGNTNSYASRIELGKINDLYTGLALDAARAERGDFEKGQTEKLGLRGARTNAVDTLAGRALVPADAENRAIIDRINQLGALTGMVHSNSLWGVGKQYDPNYEGGFFGDLNYSTGGPMGGGRGTQPGYGFRFGGPSGQPFQNTPTVRPPGSPVTTDPNFMRNFPGGGYRDQYGRWITPDPATGQWPTGGRVEFEPGWNLRNYATPIGPTPEGGFDAMADAYMDQPYPDPYADLIPNPGGYLDQYYGNYT